MLASIKYHALRISHHLGRPFQVGPHPFKARGYYASPFVLPPSHERQLLQPMRRVLEQRPGAFIDVGVNVGQTLFKLLTLDKNRPYFGFEPQLSCCFFVDQFLRQNGIDSAKVLPIALSDSNGTLKLYTGENFDEMATTVGAVATLSHRSAVSLVPARIGDEVIRELALDDIALVKIDVEGAELSVLHGLEASLRRHHPSVFFEVLPNYHGRERTMFPAEFCTQNRERADRIHAFLLACGYRVYQIDSQGNESPIDRFDLDAPERFVGSDYVAHVAG